MPLFGLTEESIIIHSCSDRWAVIRHPVNFTFELAYTSKSLLENCGQDLKGANLLAAPCAAWGALETIASIEMAHTQTQPLGGILVDGITSVHAITQEARIIQRRIYGQLNSNFRPLNSSSHQQLTACAACSAKP